MKKTIKKVLDELNTENPRLDYIRGMLEVLLDEDVPKDISINPQKVIVENTPTIPMIDPELPPPPNFKKVSPLTEE